MSDDQGSLFGGDEPPKPKKKPTRVERWQAEGRELYTEGDRKGWPVVGDVENSTGRPFCCICASYFCPHAAPGIYGKEPTPTPIGVDHGLEARTSDPVESHLAGASVEAREGTTASFTPGTHKHRILGVYATSLRPLTDTQAWQTAGISPRSAAWHRCSDLLKAGAIFHVDSIDDAETGSPVRRCSITGYGQHVLAELDAGRKVAP